MYNRLLYNANKVLFIAKTVYFMIKTVKRYEWPHNLMSSFNIRVKKDRVCLINFCGYCLSARVLTVFVKDDCHRFRRVSRFLS